MSVLTDFKLLQDLHQKPVTGDGKIVLLVLDGLGGLPLEPGGKTELETAHTPHLDRLATEGATGLSIPIRPGVEPGSGPAHLSLFGYDPVHYEIGRGVLEALGIGFELTPNDVAARGNFATVNAEGVITDRRAGRISTAECERLCAILQKATGDILPGYEVFVQPVKEHRFVLVIRGAGLGGHLTETDPLAEGRKPLRVEDESGTTEGANTAQLVNLWVDAARAALAHEPVANSLNLRGLAKDPGLPRFPDIYGVRAAAIAVYPMYKGVARLVGMEPVDVDGERPADEVRTLAAVWDQYDFFFVHVKKTDSYGEDGNFDAKVKEIEAVDAVIPQIMALNPSVVIVGGDHSTPAKLRSHSWHPVPTLIWSANAMPDTVEHFGERACAQGGFGTIHATQLIPLAMGQAGRLVRYGA
ncbi:MAG: 2,3-bisphosphoglycerate-independent phosphoglycerate mutase [Litorilinea sp.]